MPGWTLFSRVNRQRVPVYAVIGGVGRARWSSRSRRSGATTRASRSPSSRSPGSARSGSTSPTSCPCTCGCRRATASSRARGPWAEVQVDQSGRDGLRDRHGHLAVPAVHHRGVPWDDDFDWTALNYTPFVLVGRADRGRLVGVWARRSGTRARCARSRTDEGTPSVAVTLDELEEGGRRRHRRHRAAHDRRHGGPAAGQAPDGAALPRRGGRARRGGLQLPARRRRGHGHGAPATRCPAGRAATATS